MRSDHCWSHGRGSPSASFHAGSWIARARAVYTRLFLVQGTAGMAWIERRRFEIQHASTGCRQTCTLFKKLSLQSRGELVARVTITYHACDLNFESRHPLTLLLKRSFRRVAHFERRKSAGFILGEARIGSGESRLQRRQILALNLGFGDRARKSALSRSGGLTFRPLHGFEGRDVRVAFCDSCRQRGDRVLEGRGVAVRFADLLFATRKRPAQGTYFLAKRRDVRVAFCDSCRQRGDRVLEGCGVTVGFADLLFATRKRAAQGAYLLFKSRDARVPLCKCSVKCGDLVPKGGGIAARFADLLFATRKRVARGAHFLFKCRDARVAHAQLYSHEADVLHVAFERKPSLLAACLRLRQRRAHFTQKCAAARFGRAT